MKALDILKKVSCPVCHKWEYKVIDRFGSYTISRCLHCSFIFQNPRYSKEHYYDLPCQTQSDAKEHSIRRANYIYDFCKAELDRRTDLKILDVGCGNCGVMKRLDKVLHNSNFVGYTLPIDNTEVKLQQNISVIYDDIDNININVARPSGFDLIIMSHVLEHLYSPNEILRKFQTVLSSNGLIYIEVPSYVWGEVRIDPLYSPEHLSYFTINSLTNLLLQTGFNIIKLKESKYWGNIKVIVECGNFWQPKPVRTINIHNYKQLKLQKYWVQLQYPYYKWKRKHFNIGANE